MRFYWSIGDKMGEVLATIRVMPRNVAVDLNDLKDEIKRGIPPSAKLERIEEEPIAFGLTALNVFVTLEDVGGGTSKIEKALKEIEKVSQVETIDVRRVL
jgi:elongation factor 1-beta